MIKTCIFLDEDKLPPGWEKQYDEASERFYYVDHKTQITQWENPSSIETLPEPVGKMKHSLLNKES